MISNFLIAQFKYLELFHFYFYLHFVTKCSHLNPKFIICSFLNPISKNPRLKVFNFLVISTKSITMISLLNIVFLLIQIYLPRAFILKYFIDSSTIKYQ